MTADWGHVFLASGLVLSTVINIGFVFLLRDVGEHQSTAPDYKQRAWLMLEQTRRLRFQKLRAQDEASHYVQAYNTERKITLRQRAESKAVIADLNAEIKTLKACIESEAKAVSS